MNATTQLCEQTISLLQNVRRANAAIIGCIEILERRALKDFWEARDTVTCYPERNKGLK